ncbi:hypothetical protein ACFLYO_04260 [Chloroflexota bacterium]
MPISVIWDDEEHTILRYLLEGTWQWSEFRPVIAEADGLSRTVDHRVDIIADLTTSAPLPVRNAFPTLKYMAELSSDNVLQGVFVVVGGGGFVRALGKTFAQVYAGVGARIAFSDTLDEAYALIQTDREA